MAESDECLWKLEEEVSAHGDSASFERDVSRLLKKLHLAHQNKECVFASMATSLAKKIDCWCYLSAMKMAEG